MKATIAKAAITRLLLLLLLLLFYDRKYRARVRV